MSEPTLSYLKVQYDLRPAKQVERRMLIDGLQKLMAAGFPVAEYQYTGFGSIHFVDFVMLHKLLGIDDLVSVEHSTEIERRVRFNKPFRQVEIRMRSMGDVIPTLSSNKRHLVWLDYDDILNDDQLSDAYACGARLAGSSILLITVDIEPPKRSDDPREWREYFEKTAGAFLGQRSLSEYTHSALPRINLEALRGAVTKGLVGRTLEWIPLFWFVYRDTHRMLTIGGMIGGEEERARVAASHLRKTNYARLEWDNCEGFTIEVPRITRKERAVLDAHMPCEDDWVPSEFELSEREVRQYRDVYRFYPPYAELLL